METRIRKSMVEMNTLLLCRDGPVVSYDVAAPLLRVKGL